MKLHTERPHMALLHHHGKPQGLVRISPSGLGPHPGFLIVGLCRGSLVPINAPIGNHTQVTMTVPKSIQGQQTPKYRQVINTYSPITFFLGALQTKKRSSAHTWELRSLHPGFLFPWRTRYQRRAHPKIRPLSLRKEHKRTMLFLVLSILLSLVWPKKSKCRTPAKNLQLCAAVPNETSGSATGGRGETFL